MAMVKTETCSAAFGGTVEPLGFDYEIANGAATPYVVLRLQPYKKFIAENGALMKKTKAITSEMGVGNGQRQSLFASFTSAITRKAAGERFLTKHFTNTSDKPQDLVLAAAHPGQIVAVNLHEHDGELICQRGAFMAGPSGTEVSFKLHQKLGFMAFGREEIVMQKITGDDVIFLNVGGSVYCDKLEAGEEIQVDRGCLVATTKGVKTGITRSGSIGSMILGDEGMVLVNCEGPGTVWMQSMPYSRQIGLISDEQKRQRKPRIFGSDRQ